MTPLSETLHHALLSPSRTHLFGTDQFGREITERLFHGLFHTLGTALSVSMITLLIGITLGSIMALSRAGIRRLLHRVLDAFLAFPGFLLAILLATIMPPTTASTVIVLSLTSWAGFARFFDALIKSMLHEPYIEAALSTGADQYRIMMKHVYPGITLQISTQFVYSLAHSILGEASLSFLGLGGSVDNPSLGRLIAEGRQYLIEAPHLSTIPGILLVLLLLGCHKLTTTLNRYRI